MLGTIDLGEGIKQGFNWYRNLKTNSLQELLQFSMRSAYPG